MKVAMVTGDPQDYLRLEAESLREAGELAAAGLSEFVRDKERLTLIANSDGIRLHVRLSEIHLHMDPRINAEHDAEN